MHLHYVDDTSAFIYQSSTYGVGVGYSRPNFPANGEVGRGDGNGGYVSGQDEDGGL